MDKEYIWIKFEKEKPNEHQNVWIFWDGSTETEEFLCGTYGGSSISYSYELYGDKWTLQSEDGVTHYGWGDVNFPTHWATQIKPPADLPRVNIQTLLKELKVLTSEGCLKDIEILELKEKIKLIQKSFRDFKHKVFKEYDNTVEDF